MRVVAILKTAKDYPLWDGLPDHYPVSCVECNSRFEAIEKYPNAAAVMSIDEYLEFSAKLHAEYPDPRKQDDLRPSVSPAEVLAPVEEIVPDEDAAPIEPAEPVEVVTAIEIIEVKNITAAKSMWRKLWEWLCRLF